MPDMSEEDKTVTHVTESIPTNSAPSSHTSRLSGNLTEDDLLRENFNNPHNKDLPVVNEVQKPSFPSTIWGINPKRAREDDLQNHSPSREFTMIFLSAINIVVHLIHSGFIRKMPSLPGRGTMTASLDARILARRGPSNLATSEGPVVFPGLDSNYLSSEWWLDILVYSSQWVSISVALVVAFSHDWLINRRLVFWRLNNAWPRMLLRGSDPSLKARVSWWALHIFSIRSTLLDMSLLLYLVGPVSQLWMLGYNAVAAMLALAGVVGPIVLFCDITCGARGVVDKLSSPVSERAQRAVAMLLGLPPRKGGKNRMALSTGDRAPVTTDGTNQPMQYNQMDSVDVFHYFIQNGCPDLTEVLDSAQYSTDSVAAGGFGDIWKGKLFDGRHVAIKVIRFALVETHGGKNLKRLTREVYNWSKLDHENVQQLLGVIMFKGKLGMVSWWMEHGNLRHRLNENPEMERYQLCIQVARGVEYIHGIGLIHGDIKASNCLVSSAGVFKLTDFDYSIMSDCSLVLSDTTRVGGGTTRWMAPELMVDVSHQRNKQTDIYALGMTFLEIFTGVSPYHPQCLNDTQVIFKVAVMKVHPERLGNYFPQNEQGNQTWELLKSCWIHEPNSRPEAPVVLAVMKHCSIL
ncbi:kinase-like domain-containing protein [Rhizoctonia solani]|nr:kinase-like domain-containing protein [Rhizoctonia solani]